MWVQFLHRKDLLGEEMGARSRYSYLEKPVNRRAWWAPVHEVARTAPSLLANLASEFLSQFPPLLWFSPRSDSVHQRVVSAESLWFSFPISHRIRKGGMKLRTRPPVGRGLALAECCFSSHSKSTLPSTSATSFLWDCSQKEIFLSAFSLLFGEQ